MEPESVMTDKMREEFEKWASGKGLILRKATSGKQFYYLFEDTDYAWEAWQAARTVPLHAEQIRVAAVAAIREVTGCPDIKGKDGAYLVDTLIVNLLEPAAPEPKK